MGIIAKVAVALQQLLGDFAEQAAQASRVIVRRRKFRGLSLAKTFVLGFLRHPEATDEQLAQMAVSSDAAVTPQAIDQRHSWKLVQFLETLFRKGIQVVVGTNKALAPLLERFNSVTLLDSSMVTLPDSMRERFRGCGGGHGQGGGVAALKLQTELDLRSGALAHVEIEQGRSPDGATVLQHAQRPAGSLRITDLGYFNVAVFTAMVTAGVHFLSRLQFGTGVRQRTGVPLQLLRWLAQQPRFFIDQQILLGESQRLPCRLIAWRVPEEQASRRRHKLRQDTMRKRNQQPSAERLAWCDWTILVTSVPVEMMSPPEATVLYRARWQIELLFKRWKTQDRIAVLSGSTEARQMVRVWSRLLAALVQHWLVIASAWGDPTRSLSKVCEAIRPLVGRLLKALHSLAEVESLIADLCAIVAKTCRRNKRSKPGTFELLNDVRRLDFCLT